MSVYIQSATQISAQSPLTDEWLESPAYYDEKFVRSQDPKFSDFLSPIMSRRMCNLLKRTIVTARLTLQKASIEMPDAIITGTGLGCIENTEKFLHSITENDEKFLQPTYFMQSTHNIIGSLIAIEIKCHGYNNTFVNRGTSFENALLDAFLQLNQCKIKTALLGGYDELTNDYYLFLNRLGMWDFKNETATSPQMKCFAGETAVSMLLNKEKNEKTLCEVSGVELMYRPSGEQMKQTLQKMLLQANCSMEDIDAVLTGVNSNPVNDSIYDEVVNNLFDKQVLLQYKHIFGESFTSPALGTYAAATCLSKQHVPEHLITGGKGQFKQLKRILLYNHYKNKSHSFILLTQ